MPRHENPEVVGAVMALDHVGFSRQQISNILKERNVSMTKMGVHRLIARKKGGRAIMDFFVNGMFKWELFDRQPTTLEGLKKVMTSVWDNLDQAVIQKAFRGWSKRIEMMVGIISNTN